MEVPIREERLGVSIGEERLEIPIREEKSVFPIQEEKSVQYLVKIYFFVLTFPKPSYCNILSLETLCVFQCVDYL